MTENGWTRVLLGEVSRQVSDHEHDPAAAGLERYVGLEHLDPEHIVVERWGNIADGTTFTKRFRVGQLLFAKRRAYQRKAAVADFDGLCSGDLIVIEANPEALLPELLPHIVHTDRFLEHALRTSSGSLSPRTKWKDLSEYEFDLPPVDRQREIARTARAAETTIQSVATCVTHSESLSASVWHEAHTRLGEVPSVKLGDVCSVDGRLVDPKILPFADLIHVAPNNIESGSGQLRDVRSAREDGVISGKFPFTGDHVLYSKIRPNLRKAALPGFDGVCSADMYPLLPTAGMDRRYLFFTLLSPQFTAYATDRSARSGIPKINRRDLLSYEFPLPPLETQRHIVREIARVEDVSHLLTQESAMLIRIRSGLLTLLMEAPPL